ncbi:efflux RND transporter permease subunit [Planctomycetota bacterium]
MRSFIQGAIKNSPAMNTLMIAILVVGTVCLFKMRREVFPEFELEIVLISVPYPGATPDEIERGICQKIEESVQTVDGIKKMTSVAKEGSGSVILELRSDVKNVRKVVDEVDSAVRLIPSFPERTEAPEIQQITFREAAINVSVLAPKRGDGSEVAETELRAIAEKVRDELLLLPSVSQVQMQGARKYQIDVEIDEATLRKHGLSLPQVAEIVREHNLELPAGTLKSQSEEVLLRSKNKRLVGSEIEKIPIVTNPSGVALSIADLGNVRDEFADTTAISAVNGRQALQLEVQRTSREDLLAISEQVIEYCENLKLPGGYEVVAWGDRSVEVRDRLNLLIDNGRMGLLLVFLVLACFLELKLAFWVAMGIPISMLGAGGILLGLDQTLNMLSMFAFLMALGIIVDDAIVVGENIYAHRQMGKSSMQAAIDGTVEVVPSVTASVTTTVIAFCPLLFVSGIMGKFIAVMPISVIAMLVISLFESTTILPCHLAHSDSLLFRVMGFFFYPIQHVIVPFFAWINSHTSRALHWFVENIYLKVLAASISHKSVTLAAACGLLIVTIGFVKGGFVPFVLFPKIDSTFIVCNVTFPDGTPASVTDRATKRIATAMKNLKEEHGDVTKVIFRNVGSMTTQQGPGGTSVDGSHAGAISVELVDSSERDVTSQQLIADWRAAVGDIPGIDSISYNSIAAGPGGTPIEFKLLADAEHVDQLEAAVDECKVKLATFNGVFDVSDDSKPGKWEFQISLKDKAKSMGIREKDIADTIRASYYGAEVMRLQRGRHEVKLMVRYPPEERRSFADFEDIRIRGNDGQERPITELADIDVVRGYSEINRLNQRRSITISADVNEKEGNASEIVATLQGRVSTFASLKARITGEEPDVNAFIPELLAKHPGVSVNWEGQKEQSRESLRSLGFATIIALLVMYALLTFQFKSYVQPLIIMCVIPFGIVGAIFGHFVMDLPITLFSFFGLVALTGVVVNDSIVLIDFINARVRSGLEVSEALMDAGRRRFRPVLLTSATTIAGLFPILLETSFQAQYLIPMAASLAFGLMLATVLVLVLVPTFYQIYRDGIAWFQAYDMFMEHDEEEYTSPVELSANA